MPTTPSYDRATALVFLVMAKHTRARIAIFFLGGSVIDSRGRRGDVVSKASQVEPWMANMSEMDIIADTEGFFVASGHQAIGLKEWSQLAHLIERSYASFDGFVVVHDLQTIAPAAVMLALMTTGLEKPIVLVGSPLTVRGQRSAPSLTGGQDFGAKASMINAVQVATSDIAEVAVVLGSTIFRGASVSVAATAQPGLQGTVLGKVDFGIRLLGKQIRRAKRKFRIRATFDTQVAVIDYLPGMQAKPPGGSHPPSGYFLSVAEGFGDQRTITDLIRKLAPVPIAVYAPGGQGSLPTNALILRDPNRTNALLRFMWALGQTHDPKKIQALLTRETT